MAKRRPDMRVMLDANILIAGSVWPRWPYEILQHALQGDFQLVLSRFVINQARRRIRLRFPNHIEQFEDFLQTCQYELVPDPTQQELDQHRDLVRDVTDIPVALAAINAKVETLVSEDKDLTARDGTTIQLHQQLKVFISGTFLREVMGWSSAELDAVRGRTWRDLQIPEDE